MPAARAALSPAARAALSIVSVRLKTGFPDKLDAHLHAG